MNDDRANDTCAEATIDDAWRTAPDSLAGGSAAQRAMDPDPAASRRGRDPSAEFFRAHPTAKKAASASTGVHWRKKPIVIEAVWWSGAEADLPAMFAFIGDFAKLPNDGAYVQPGVGYIPAIGVLEIPTLEGKMAASPGDYIIRGIEGELYPCKASIFEATYERADAPPSQPSPVPASPKDDVASPSAAQTVAQAAGEYDAADDGKTTLATAFEAGAAWMRERVLEAAPCEYCGNLPSRGVHGEDGWPWRHTYRPPAWLTALCASDAEEKQ